MSAVFFWRASQSDWSVESPERFPVSNRFGSVTAVQKFPTLLRQSPQAPLVYPRRLTEAATTLMLGDGRFSPKEDLFKVEF